MKFELENKITPWDFFLASIKKIYSSPVGVCNIVFTAAAIGLAVRFFNTVGDLLQVLILFACLWFPFFQPIGIYFKAKSQVAMIPKNMKYIIDDSGIQVFVGDKTETIRWNRVSELINKKNMIIIRVDGTNGYFFSNKSLGKQKEEFISFVEGKIKH